MKKEENTKGMTWDLSKWSQFYFWLNYAFKPLDLLLYEELLRVEKFL